MRKVNMSEYHDDYYILGQGVKKINPFVALTTADDHRVQIHLPHMPGPYDTADIKQYMNQFIQIAEMCEKFNNIYKGVELVDDYD